MGKLLRGPLQANFERGFYQDRVISLSGSVTLRAEQVVNENAARGDQTPEMNLAATLRKILGEVLGTEAIENMKVTADPNIFDLGMTSIRVLEVTSRLQAVYPDLGITPTDLFRCPTITQLADSLAARRTDPLTEPESKPAPTTGAVRSGQDRAALRLQARQRR
jgi:aryl carrier-like protein